MESFRNSYIRHFDVVNGYSMRHFLSSSGIPESLRSFSLRSPNLITSLLFVSTKTTITISPGRMFGTMNSKANA